MKQRPILFKMNMKETFTTEEALYWSQGKRIDVNQYYGFKINPSIANPQPDPAQEHPYGVYRGKWFREIVVGI